MLSDLDPPNRVPMSPEAAALMDAASKAMGPRRLPTGSTVKVRFTLANGVRYCNSWREATEFLAQLMADVREAKTRAREKKGEHRDARCILGLALLQLREACRESKDYGCALSAIDLNYQSAERAVSLLILCDLFGKVDWDKVEARRAERREWIKTGKLHPKFEKRPEMSSTLEALTERQMLELVKDPAKIKRKGPDNTPFQHACGKTEAGVNLTPEQAKSMDFTGRSAPTPNTYGGYPRDLGIHRAGAGAAPGGAVVGADAADPDSVLPAGGDAPAAVAGVAVLPGNTGPVPAANAAPAGVLPVVGRVEGLVMAKQEAPVGLPKPPGVFEEFIKRAQAAAAGKVPASPAVKPTQMTFEVMYQSFEARLPAWLDMLKAKRDCGMLADVIAKLSATFEGEGR